MTFSGVKFSSNCSRWTRGYLRRRLRSDGLRAHRRCAGSILTGRHRNEGVVIAN